MKLKPKPEGGDLLISIIGAIVDTGVKRTDGKPVRAMKLDYYLLPDGKKFRIDKGKRVYFK